MTDLEQMIMQMEGTGPVKNGRFQPYLDSLGKLTIGYGHCLDTKGLSSDVVMMQFKIDLADAIADARRVCSIYDQLSRPRQMVLISMAFQMGLEGLRKWPLFLDALHREAWDEAADELLNSRVAREQAPERFQTLARMWRGNTTQWL